MQPFKLKRPKKVAFECKKVALESYFFLIYYGMYRFLDYKKDTICASFLMQPFSV